MILRRVMTRAFIAAPLLLIPGCDSATGPGGPGRGAANWQRVTLDERVTDAYTGFGFELFRDLRSAKPHANVFASPTSAAVALAMTYNGAVGQTADEMAEALGVAHVDRDTLNETNRKWLEALSDVGDPHAELALANSVWHKQSRPVLDSFREVIGEYYDAVIEPITTADAINAWVDEHTRGRIDEIITEVPGNVVAYLINALYFKADWTYPFDPDDTRTAPFHRPDGTTVDVPMMSQQADLETRSDADMTMLRLPYGAERFSMILALPHDDSSLDVIAERLDAERWQQWLTEFDEVARVNVRLPRFEIEWEESFVESLQHMGMVVPFTAGADFSDMFAGGGPWIDDVFQKTFLRVDEKGSEAAAVTTVVMVESAPPEIAFDRPFFLAIYDHATETVLFLGQITDPTA